MVETAPPWAGVSEEFVRNTSPDWISAAQGGFPVAMRDADLIIELHEDLPDALHEAVDFGAGLILRTDRRLGFDPASEWTTGGRSPCANTGCSSPKSARSRSPRPMPPMTRFFKRPVVQAPNPPWLEALRGRDRWILPLPAWRVSALLVGAATLSAKAAWRGWRNSRRCGWALLAVMTGFVGFWGQGQLSIVTPLATALRTALEGGSFAFLIYDSFSLVIWGFAILGLFLWGRGSVLRLALPLWRVAGICQPHRPPVAHSARIEVLTRSGRRGCPG